MPKTRGTGSVLTGEQADLADYLAFHEGPGKEVQLFTFNTTREEEETIIERGFERGDIRFLNCSLDVSSALNGIGPFKKLGVYRAPGFLADRLLEIKLGR